MLEKLWLTEVQVFPLILAFLIFKVPGYIHSLKKDVYVPIYFSVFPFSLLNTNLSTYMAEDYYGTEMTEIEAEKFRIKMIIVSSISITISVALIPALTGFLSAFFLTEKTMIHFLIVMFLYLLFITTKSLLNFKYHSVANKNNKIILSIIYFFYIGIVIWIINNSYNWAFSYVQVKSWSKMFVDFFDLLFGEIGFKLIFLLIVTNGFSMFVSSRNVRRDNIKKYK